MWDNLPLREELTDSEHGAARHKYRKHFPSLETLLGTLSKMCEFSTHCHSLPSEACSSLHSPEGCSATPPPFLQIPPASLYHQVSKTCFIIECLWPEGYPTSQSFNVRPDIFVAARPEPIGGG